MGDRLKLVYFFYIFFFYVVCEVNVFKTMHALPVVFVFFQMRFFNSKKGNLINILLTKY